MPQADLVIPGPILDLFQAGLIKAQEMLLLSAIHAEPGGLRTSNIMLGDRFGSSHNHTGFLLNKMTSRGYISQQAFNGRTRLLVSKLPR